MDQAGLARTRRQGGIEALGRQAGVEFGILQFGAAGLDQGGERVLEPVQIGTALAALLGRGASEIAQQGGETAVAAERGDADGVPGAQVGGGGEGSLGFGLEGWRGRRSWECQKKQWNRRCTQMHADKVLPDDPAGMSGPQFGADAPKRLGPHLRASACICGSIFSPPAGSG